MIRIARLEDAAEICGIYNYYVVNSTFTFEEKPIAVSVMKRRMKDILDYSSWLVEEHDGNILGYSYAARWKERSAYRYSVESTVYVDKEHYGSGIGKALYSALLGFLENNNVHVILGGIALPNEKSIKLHERLGFRKVAQLEEVGFKFNKWIDVGYWELRL